MNVLSSPGHFLLVFGALLFSSCSMRDLSSLMASNNQSYRRQVQKEIAEQEKPKIAIVLPSSLSIVDESLNKSIVSPISP